MTEKLFNYKTEVFKIKQCLQYSTRFGPQKIDVEKFNKL
jgi:hypothetical protein